MASQIDHLRSSFNTMNTAQKKVFIDNLTQKLKGVNNAEYTKFLNECVSVYNSENRSDSIDFDIEDIPVAAPSGIAREDSLLLVSGSGKDHKAIASWWIKTLLIGGGTSGFFLLIGFELNRPWHPNLPSTGDGDFLILLSIISMIIFVYEGFSIQSRISNTEIRVYEHDVRGKSVPLQYPWTISSSMSDFQLNYDQISSVDVVDEGILVIHATGVQHKCYAMNAGQIRDVILDQKNSTRRGNRLS